MSVIVKNTENASTTSQSSLPDYLNLFYIKQLLSRAYKFNENAFKLIKCNIKCITQAGENFCSNVYRVYVEYLNPNTQKLVTEHLILKILLPIFDDISTNEIVMFTEILPVMADILKDIKLTKCSPKLNARCLLAEHVHREIYLMEDLNSLGYSSTNRCTGMDETYARLALDKLAVFHAASFVLMKQQPTLLDKLEPSHFSQGSDSIVMKYVVLEGLKYVADLIGKWPGYESIAAKISKNLPSYSDHLKEIVDPAKSAINCLVHGDIWVNNMLFKCEADEMTPFDAVFVDFQNSTIGTPAIDLQFFLYTSVKLTVLQTKRYELVRHYYHALVSTLKKLDATIQPPTWQSLVDEIRRCAFYGFYAAICEMPLCSMEKHVSEGFDALLFSDAEKMLEKRNLLYANERVVETARYALDYFNEIGALDIA